MKIKKITSFADIFLSASAICSDHTCLRLSMQGQDDMNAWSKFGDWLKLQRDPEFTEIG